MEGEPAGAQQPEQEQSLLTRRLRPCKPGSVQSAAQTRPISRVFQPALVGAPACDTIPVPLDPAQYGPHFPGLLVDTDRDAAFAALRRLHLARRAMRIVPTHDHDAAADL